MTVSELETCFNALGYKTTGVQVVDRGLSFTFDEAKEKALVSDYHAFWLPIDTRYYIEDEELQAIFDAEKIGLSKVFLVVFSVSADNALSNFRDIIKEIYSTDNIIGRPSRMPVKKGDYSFYHYAPENDTLPDRAEYEALDDSSADGLYSVSVVLDIAGLKN